VIQAEFYFHGSLTAFLPRARQGSSVEMVFSPHQTVKHLVESLRIPHTEVSVILVNDQVVGMSSRLKNHDRVDVFPFDADINHQRPGPATGDSTKRFDVDWPAGEPRFLLDNHLGKLAVYLRMLGFDTWYRNDYQDPELASLAEESLRVLLTRDRGLLMRKQVKLGYCLRSLSPRQQVGEVLLRFDLLSQIQPFKRCLRCNHPLVPVIKAEIMDRLLPLTSKYYDEFHLCSHCDQVYWRGSHYEAMAAFIDRLRQRPGQCE
jgi:uncharacterized protein with PIN domain/sulfur carrier protein ThiS